MISKYVKALKKYSDIFNKAKQKEKFKLLYPLKAAGFSLNESRKLNFKASKRLWNSCSDILERNPGGRPRINSDIVKEINCHVLKNSSFAANRFLKKENENALYRNMSFIRLYHTFPLRSTIAFSTFRKNIRNIYKKPHRFSDLCDYCEKGKVIFFTNFFIF